MCVLLGNAEARSRPNEISIGRPNNRHGKNSTWMQIPRHPTKDGTQGRHAAEQDGMVDGRVTKCGVFSG